MKYLAVIVAAMLIGWGFVCLLGADNALQQVFAAVVLLSGLLAFGIGALAALTDTVIEVGRKQQAGDARTHELLERVVEAAEQTRLHSEVIRKVKEVEHVRAKQARQQRKG